MAVWTTLVTEARVRTGDFDLGGVLPHLYVKVETVPEDDSRYSRATAVSDRATFGANPPPGVRRSPLIAESPQPASSFYRLPSGPTTFRMEPKHCVVPCEARNVSWPILASTASCRFLSSLNM